MQSVSARIWTRVAVSISYDDNHYTTDTSLYTTGTFLNAVLNKNKNDSEKLVFNFTTNFYETSMG